MQGFYELVQEPLCPQNHSNGKINRRGGRLPPKKALFVG